MAIGLAVINLVALVVLLDWGHGILNEVAAESDNAAADKAAEQLSEARASVLFGLRLATLIALPFLILFLVMVGMRYSRAAKRDEEAMELRSYYRKTRHRSKR